MHLIIDGYRGSFEKLTSVEFIRDLLSNYPAKIGMNKIDEPHVTEYVGKNPNDWGVSGFVLIAESHISIHTFPEHSYINIDVFSCRNFDHTKVTDDMKEQFELTRCNTYILSRGLEGENTQIPMVMKEV